MAFDNVSTPNNMYKYAYGSPERFRQEEGPVPTFTNNLSATAFKSYTTPSVAIDTTPVPQLDKMIGGNIGSGQGYGMGINADGTRSYYYLPPSEHAVSQPAVSKPVQPALPTQNASKPASQPAQQQPAQQPTRSKNMSNYVSVPNYINTADSRYTVNPVEQPKSTMTIANPRYLGGAEIRNAPKKSYNPARWGDNVMRWLNTGIDNIKNFYGFGR